MVMTMTHPSAQQDHEWRRLMMAAQTGEAGSYARLIGAVTPFLRSVAKRRLGKIRNAERAAQQALITAYSRRRAYDPTRPIGPWLKDIVDAEAQRFAVGAAAR